MPDPSIYAPGGQLDQMSSYPNRESQVAAKRRGPQPGTGGRPKKYASDGSMSVHANPDVTKRIRELADLCDVGAYEFAQDVLGQVKDLDDAFPIPVLLGLDPVDVAALDDYARAWAEEEPDRAIDNEGHPLPTGAIVQAWLRSLIAAGIVKRLIV
jgi:hypothetical protein